MNDRSGSDFDGLDPELEALFRREHTQVPSEPFLSATLRVVATERRRAALKTKLVVAAAVLGVVLLSPQLIAGSIWVSAQLDALFAVLSTWLASPGGMAVAGAVALTAFVVSRAPGVRAHAARGALTRWLLRRR